MFLSRNLKFACINIKFDSCIYKVYCRLLWSIMKFASIIMKCALIPLLGPFFPQLFSLSIRTRTLSMLNPFPAGLSTLTVYDDIRMQNIQVLQVILRTIYFFWNTTVRQRYIFLSISPWNLLSYFVRLILLLYLVFLFWFNA